MDGWREREKGRGRRERGTDGRRERGREGGGIGKVAANMLCRCLCVCCVLCVFETNTEQTGMATIWQTTGESCLNYPAVRQNNHTLASTYGSRHPSLTCLSPLSKD